MAAPVAAQTGEPPSAREDQHTWKPDGRPLLHTKCSGMANGYDDSRITERFAAGPRMAREWSMGAAESERTTLQRSLEDETGRRAHWIRIRR